MRRDTIHSKTFVQLLGNQVVTGDLWSAYVDLQGYENVAIIVAVGDLGSIDGSNHLDITVQHAAATPASAGSYSEVAAADLITDAGYGALPIDVDSTTLDNLTYVASYIGTNRYLAVNLNETGTVSGPVSITVILEGASIAPNIADTPTTGSIS